MSTNGQITTQRAEIQWAFGLANFMDLRGMRQTELAQAAGIVSDGEILRPNTIQITRYLKGQLPGVVHLRNIAAVLDVTETELLAFPVPRGAKLPARIKSKRRRRG
jgi:transcriptional regulator with XRE-family HTH domain